MEKGIKVTLLACTDNLDIAEIAAKVCYSPKDIESIVEGMKVEDYNPVLPHVIESGHHSVLEHISFTFGIEGVSRVFSHQLVRHRIASFSQKSQRYVDESDWLAVVPPSIENTPEAKEIYSKVMETIREGYNALRKIKIKDTEDFIPKEDVRFVLPNACGTSLVMTMNARQLLHFFSLRCCNRAQWEIREFANKALTICNRKIPQIFKYAGAPCQFGKCPEKKPCGNPLPKIK